jgi:soluble lytic murein transglycosylase
MQNTAPNKDANPIMSSMFSKTLVKMAIASVVIGPALCSAPVFAQNWGGAQQPSISTALSQWEMLRRTDNMPFTSYASFLLANPGWPGEKKLRDNAERMLRPGSDPASIVIAFFEKFQPQSATSWLRYAEALQSSGRREQALPAARNAWRTGALTQEDEARFLSQFGSMLTSEDHDVRMDTLLWSRSTNTAIRQIANVSTRYRPLFSARLAMLTKSPDVASKMSVVSPADKQHPGYVADYNWWLRNTGNRDAAVSQIAQPRDSGATPPASPETWLEMRLINANTAASSGQWQNVYAIARQADDAYPAGTVVRDRSIKERDIYTDLVWLGARTALTRINRPADAEYLFGRYEAAAKSPQTRSKGAYWAGRAAEMAGNRASAIKHYETAGAFFDQFHGQLALERLGRKPVSNEAPRTIAISAAERAAFNNRSVVRALIALNQQGRNTEQAEFIRTLSTSIKSDADHVLATELAKKINRTDLMLLAGKNARNNGLSDYLVTAFPQMEVPPEKRNSWTMIHAITRQESQFDRHATSRVGAKGLMQLMPGTARETAPRAGLYYSYESLSDPQYNVSLGSTYFNGLMSQYGGSYVLAVAAYNAGPGNVNRWVRNNGDPRAGADVLNWIENIPFEETRNYVQRVLENAVVYDMLNPAKANVRTNTPLSTYLGKRSPG